MQYFTILKHVQRKSISTTKRHLFCIYPIGKPLSPKCLSEFIKFPLSKSFHEPYLAITFSLGYFNTAILRFSLFNEARLVDILTVVSSKTEASWKIEAIVFTL